MKMTVGEKRTESDSVEFLRLQFAEKEHILGLPLGHRVELRALVDGNEIKGTTTPSPT